MAKEIATKIQIKQLASDPGYDCRKLPEKLNINSDVNLAFCRQRLGGSRSKAVPFIPTLNQMNQGQKSIVPTAAKIRANEDEYDGLTDRYLNDYFKNPMVLDNLRRAGLIADDGRILSDKEYRKMWSIRDQRKEVRKVINETIMNHAAEFQLGRQLELQRQLDAVEKVENYRKVKGLTTSPDGVMYTSNLPSLSASMNSQKSGILNYPTTGIRPVEGFDDDSAANRNFESSEKYKLLHKMDPVSLRLYRIHLMKELNKINKFRENMGDQIMPRTHSNTLGRLSLNSSFSEKSIKEIYFDPVSGRSRSVKPSKSNLTRTKSTCTAKELYDQRAKSVQESKRQANTKRSFVVSGGRSRSRPRKLCKCYLQYIGSPGINKGEVLVKHKIIIAQFQERSLNAIRVFDNELEIGDEIAFESMRFSDSPFQIVLTENDKSVTINACCEARIKLSKKLGGSKGAFKWRGVSYAVPCQKCQTVRGYEMPFTNVPTSVRENAEKNDVVRPPPKTQRSYAQKVEQRQPSKPHHLQKLPQGNSRPNLRGRQGKELKLINEKNDKTETVTTKPPIQPSKPKGLKPKNSERQNAFRKNVLAAAVSEDSDDLPNGATVKDASLRDGETPSVISKTTAETDTSSSSSSSESESEESDAESMPQVISDDETKTAASQDQWAKQASDAAKEDEDDDTNTNAGAENGSVDSSDTGSTCSSGSVDASDTIDPDNQPFLREDTLDKTRSAALEMLRDELLIKQAHELDNQEPVEDQAVEINNDTEKDETNQEAANQAVEESNVQIAESVVSQSSMGESEKMDDMEAEASDDPEDSDFFDNNAAENHGDVADAQSVLAIETADDDQNESKADSEVENDDDDATNISGTTAGSERETIISDTDDSSSTISSDGDHIPADSKSKQKNKKEPVIVDNQKENNEDVVNGSNSLEVSHKESNQTIEEEGVNEQHDQHEEDGNEAETQSLKGVKITQDSPSEGDDERSEAKTPPGIIVEGATPTPSSARARSSASQPQAPSVKEASHVTAALEALEAHEKHEAEDVADEPFVPLVDLDENKGRSLPDDIKYMCTLEDVSIHNKQFTEQQVADLALLLGENTSIKSLTLRGCDITTDQLSVIVDGLKSNSSQISVLNLNMNKLDANAVPILEELLDGRPIDVLFLRENNLGNDGVTSLIATLQKLQWQPNGHGIVKLDLGENDISYKGASAVGRLLISNPKLSHLSLSGNGEITPTAWELIATGIKDAKAMQSIGFDYCKMGDNSAAEVCRSLQFCPELRSIDFEGNDLGEKGGQAVYDLCRGNSQIDHANVMAGNTIPNFLLERLENMIKGKPPKSAASTTQSGRLSVVP